MSATSAAIGSVRRPQPLDLGGDVSHELDAAAARHDVGAGVGEPERERAADAARAADDDGRAAGQIEQLHEVWSDGRRPAPDARTTLGSGGGAGPPEPVEGLALSLSKGPPRRGMSVSAAGSCA